MRVLVARLVAVVSLFVVFSASAQDFPRRMSVSAALHPERHDTGGGTTQARDLLLVLESADGSVQYYRELHCGVETVGRDERFEVVLGSTDPLGNPLDVAFDAEYWLAVTECPDAACAAGDPGLCDGAPLLRAQISAVGYAFRARVADTAAETDHALTADHATTADTATTAASANTAGYATTAGLAIEAEHSLTAAIADTAGDADRLGGFTASQFVKVGAAAGGDLTGTYPSPQVAPSSITGAKVADGSLSLYDLGGGSAVPGDVATWNGSSWVPSSVPGPALGDGPENAAASCSVLHAARPAAGDGVYWLQPSAASAPFQALCDMTTSGGGWTLVWSNLRGGRAKPTTELAYAAAIATPPRLSGPLGTNRETFTVYTGLSHWTPLAPSGEMRYDWSPDYGAAVTQAFRASFALNAADSYRLTLSGFVQTAGATPPGLYTYLNNMKFTAWDRDNDTYAPGNCAAFYAGMPFWYRDCWYGSLNGGGELSNNLSQPFNGAYWSGLSVFFGWGVPSGDGAGNGWIYVR